MIAQYAVEMRVCAEKNCGADISNRRGNAKRCLECAKNRYWECERAYFKSSKGRAAQKKYLDILAVLKDDDSYGAHSGCMPG